MAEPSLTLQMLSQLRFPSLQAHGKKILQIKSKENITEAGEWHYIPAASQIVGLSDSDGTQYCNSDSP